MKATEIKMEGIKLRLVVMHKQPAKGVNNKPLIIDNRQHHSR